MRISSRGQAAVDALLDLALHQGGGPVSLARVSERMAVSLSYLEQIFGKLREKEIVASVRGSCGGYVLARPLHEITVAEIMLAVEKTLGMKGNCHDSSPDTPGLAPDLWNGLNTIIMNYFVSVSLSQLVERAQSAQDRRLPHAIAA